MLKQNVQVQEEIKCPHHSDDESKIIGFCINELCSNDPSFCKKCKKSETHSLHQKECLTLEVLIKNFEKVSLVYQNMENDYLNNLQQWNINVEKVQKLSPKISSKFLLATKFIIELVESNNKEIQSEKQKILNMIGAMTNKNFTQCRNNFGLISKLCQSQIHKNNHSQCSFLEQGQNILTSLIFLNQHLSSFIIENRKLKHWKQREKVKKDYKILLEQALEIQAKLNKAHQCFRKGLNLFKNSKFQEAIYFFKIELSMYLNQPLIQLLIVKSLCEMKHYEKTLKYLDNVITEKIIQMELEDSENKNKVQNNQELQIEAKSNNDQLDIIQRQQNILDELLKIQKEVLGQNAILKYQQTNLHQQLLLEKGMVLRKLSRNQEAHELFDDLFMIDPNSQEELFLTGITLYEQQKYEEALLWFDEALRLDLKSAQLHYGKAQSLFKLGNFEEAIQQFDEILLLDLENQNISFNHFEIGLSLNRQLLCKEQLKVLQKLEMKKAQVFYRKGRSLHRLFRFQEAIELYEESLGLCAENPYGYYYKGISLVQIKRYEEAIQCFDKVSNFGFRIKDFQYEKAIALSKLNQYQQALDSLDNFLKFEFNSYKAYRFKGVLLGNLGQTDQAIQCFDKALKLNPAYAKSYYDKGFVLLNNEMCDQSIICFDQAISIDPNQQCCYFSKGRALQKLQNHQQAIECFNQAILIDPTFSNAYFQKGYSLSVLHNKQQSIRCYNEGLIFDPTNPYAHNIKGNDLRSKKKYLEAIQCYDIALQLQPNNQTFLENKSIAVEKLLQQIQT